MECSLGHERTRLDVVFETVNRMGLDESCEKYLGCLVAVKPIYGWGWSRVDAPEVSVPAEINVYLVLSSVASKSSFISELS